jgi:excisionase family DNA binding protein
MDSATDAIEAHRKVVVRLRLLLLGDGSEAPGLVRGEDSRLRVSAELRHLRDACDALLEGDERRTEEAESRVAHLEEDLLRIASLLSRAQQAEPAAIPALLTPAECARVLRVSVSSIYSAVRNGKIRAVKLTDQKRGGLRIPVSELERLIETGSREPSTQLSGAKGGDRART